MDFPSWKPDSWFVGFRWIGLSGISGCECVATRVSWVRFCFSVVAVFGF